MSLFGQLYISMQSREGDLEEFFSHEVQSFPPSMSEFGKLYLPGTKSELMKSLEPLHESMPPDYFWSYLIFEKNICILDLVRILVCDIVAMPGKLILFPVKDNLTSQGISVSTSENLRMNVAKDWARLEMVKQNLLWLVLQMKLLTMAFVWLLTKTCTGYQREKFGPKIAFLGDNILLENWSFVG